MTLHLTLHLAPDWISYPRWHGEEGVRSPAAFVARGAYRRRICPVAQSANASFLPSQGNACGDPQGFAFGGRDSGLRTQA